MVELNLKAENIINQSKYSLYCHPIYLLRCISPYQKAACWMKRFPFCHFPYAKYSGRLHGSNRMGFALADSVSSAERPMKPKQRLGV